MASSLVSPMRKLPHAIDRRRIHRSGRCGCYVALGVERAGVIVGFVGVCSRRDVDRAAVSRNQLTIQLSVLHVGGDVSEIVVEIELERQCSRRR
jgi:hypothetical protein